MCLFQSCEASLGNSDLHRPLRSCQLLSGGRESRDQLNVFIVSDGHWTNMSALMSSAKLHWQHTRIFTLGVGSVVVVVAVAYLVHVVLITVTVVVIVVDIMYWVEDWFKSSFQLRW